MEIEELEKIADEAEREALEAVDKVLEELSTNKGHIWDKRTRVCRCGVREIDFWRTHGSLEHKI